MKKQAMDDWIEPTGLGGRIYCLHFRPESSVEADLRDAEAMVAEYRKIVIEKCKEEVRGWACHARPAPMIGELLATLDAVLEDKC